MRADGHVVAEMCTRQKEVTPGISVPVPSDGFDKTGDGASHASSGAVATVMEPPKNQQGRPYYDSEKYPTLCEYVRFTLGLHDGSPDSQKFKRNEKNATIADVYNAEIPEKTANSSFEAITLPCGIRLKSKTFSSNVPEHLLQKACKELPEEVILHEETATKEKIIESISKCKKFDDITLRGGTKVNDTAYPQPRRMTYSTVTRGVYKDSEGRDVNDMFSYWASYRNLGDFECRPMPKAIFDLMIWCWKEAFHSLTPMGQVCPPTACQVNIYMQIFGGSIGRHRDNGGVGEGKTGGSPGHVENSQIPGTPVLSFSIGETMRFTLHRPVDLKNPHRTKNSEYKNFDNSIQLGSRDILIWESVDDETFLHGAKFYKEDMTGYKTRVVFLFRWLSKVHTFDVETRKLVH